MGRQAILLRRPRRAIRSDEEGTRALVIDIAGGITYSESILGDRRAHASDM